MILGYQNIGTVVGYSNTILLRLLLIVLQENETVPTKMVYGI